MKKFLIVVPLFFSLSATAQTVIKVTGSEALVNMEGEAGYVVGDTIHFLDSELNSSGQGQVKKISAGGKKALIKVISGVAKEGMTLEKMSSRAEVGEKQTVPRTEGVSYAALSEKERDILQAGEISKSRYVVGGILGTWPLGFGIGHAIQGRYTDKGWIFTVGELGSISLAVAGLGDCWAGSRYETCNGGLVFAGVMAYVGFKVWEIVDLWAGPPEHNRRYREIRGRMGEGEVTFLPTLMPLADGGVLGVRMTF